ncbi:MAG: DUF1501 domain-containing protein [Planctomycetia bacterium]|nr:DUF1501 domain-containing protein [Planctomycetia bacterium]
MLTLFGKKHTLCDGITRRNFLKIGAFGAGLTLADMLRANAAANGKASRPKSVIMVWQCGGPPHQDTYDLKPDAPAEIRGEFQPIATNVPGIQISEYYPLQAKIFDKLAVIRSVRPVDGGHSDWGVSTGYNEESNKREHHPSLGSVISKVRGGSNADVPPYVSLRGTTPALQAGYLGVAHNPFTPSGPGIENLRLARGVEAPQLDDRRHLLSSFDTLRRDLDSSGSMSALDAHNARAFDMIASGAVRNALDLSREPQAGRDRYKGIEGFLTARRLVEAGVGCITLCLGGSIWDTHSNNFPTLKQAMPPLDRALFHLINDLHDRGLQDDVITVACGEFGRTPRINKEGGRDHHGSVMSVLVAGGGLKMGQVIGSTDARAERIKDRPYSLPQVYSTVYRALGIDPSQTFPNAAGRPMYILDDRDPVTELL